MPDKNSISKAAGIIEQETGGELYGLVNNAGLGLVGALEVTPLDEIRMKPIKKYGLRLLVISAMLFGLVGCSFFNDCSSGRRKLP